MSAFPFILPGLTSTKKEGIPAFIEEMHRLKIDRIALFPTCLTPSERKNLYAELERLNGLFIPHVHITDDADEGELDLLAERFKTEVFNIHPLRSTHPFPSIPDRYRDRFFVENVDMAPEAEEVAACGGLCIDYSHWENAKRFDNPAYAGFDALAEKSFIGCCHVSAFRRNEPNIWNGGWDHHEHVSLSDFNYLRAYASFLPQRWISLELENPLAEQLEVAKRLSMTILSTRSP